MSTALMLDILVSVLLVVMIGYAALLSRRLSHLRSGRGEMESAIAAFSAASQAAETSVQKLKHHAESRKSDLQESIDSGRAMREELVFLLDRAEEQAKRLEELIRSGRVPKGPSLVVNGGRDGDEVNLAIGSDVAEEPVKERSEAESALLKTLAGLR